DCVHKPVASGLHHAGVTRGGVDDVGLHRGDGGSGQVGGQNARLATGAEAGVADVERAAAGAIRLRAEPRDFAVAEAGSGLVGVGDVLEERAAACQLHAEHASALNCVAGDQNFTLGDVDAGREATDLRARGVVQVCGRNVFQSAIAVDEEQLEVAEV